jgi:hypothetical protein
VVRGPGTSPIGVFGNDHVDAHDHNYDARPLDFVRQPAGLCGAGYSQARLR